MSDNSHLQLSALEKEILMIVQEGLPLCHSPYAAIADIISNNVTEQQVHRTLLDLIDRGIIRRIGGVFDTPKLGFASSLVAMRLPDDRIDEAGEIVSACTGVSHNYRRDCEYNLWFTLAAPSEAKLQGTLRDLEQRCRPEDTLYLPTLKVHKILVRFDVKDRTNEMKPR